MGTHPIFESDFDCLTAERGVQVKASSTTRAIQTGKFTRETSTETTPVESRDQSTQKKLRKPKVRHFGQQFRPRNLRAAAVQWDENDIPNQTSREIERVIKGFEFRNSVTRFCAAGSSRTADAILRRLHDQ